MITILIGFVARERFSVSDKSLESLIKNTTIPHKLLVINSNYPHKYLTRLKKILLTHPNSEIVNIDSYVTPNKAKNLVISKSDGYEFVVLVENDLLVPKGWLRRMLHTLNMNNADIVRPMIIEKFLFINKTHFDLSLGSISTIMKNKIRYYRFTAQESHDVGVESERRRVQTVETHLLLFRREVFDKIGYFNELLMSRDLVEMSLLFYKFNQVLFFEPTVKVTFLPPVRIQASESQFFDFIWNEVRTIESYNSLLSDWNILDFQPALRFVRDRRHFKSYYGILSLALEFVKSKLSSKIKR